MSFATADLSDEHPEAVAARPDFSPFGGRRRFSGPIRTVRCWEDNSMVSAALQSPGEGSVLVVDGGASLRCALLGDRLGALAVANSWSGVIVNGCVRDTAALALLDVGVMALAAHPQRSEKRGGGDRDVPVTFAGVEFVPGAWVYADEDGVLVLPTAIG